MRRRYTDHQRFMMVATTVTFGVMLMNLAIMLKDSDATSRDARHAFIILGWVAYAWIENFHRHD